MIPELLRGQALQSYLPPAHVPVGYVFLQVAFEILERLPLAASVELVLDVAEELLGAALSMQFAFLDMLWTMPAASSLDVYEACWYCRPRSECMVGAAPGYLMAE